MEGERDAYVDREHWTQLDSVTNQITELEGLRQQLEQVLQRNAGLRYTGHTQVPAYLSLWPDANSPAACLTPPRYLLAGVDQPAVRASLVSHSGHS